MLDRSVILFLKMVYSDKWIFGSLTKLTVPFAELKKAQTKGSVSKRRIQPENGDH